MQYENQTEKDNRTLGDLFSELTQETGDLLRQEFRLARVEVSEKITQAQRGLISLAVGGLIAYAGFLALIATAIIALAQVVQWWLAALAVGVVVVLVGLWIVEVGREKLKAKNLALHRTNESLQEDKQWAKAQMK